MILPGDIALQEATASGPRLKFPLPTPSVRPSDREIDALAEVLNRGRKITILGGAGCAGARAEMIEVATKLKAPIRSFRSISAASSSDAARRSISAWSET